MQTPPLRHNPVESLDPLERAVMLDLYHSGMRVTAGIPLHARDSLSEKGLIEFQYIETKEGPIRHFAIITENAKKMIESLPIAQATPEFARRSNDDKHSLESRAREIAKQEGPTSLVASTLAIIDAHRRSGRVIEIVGVTDASDGTDRHSMGGRTLHWQERPSMIADRLGYLDGHSGLVKPKHTLDHKHVNRLGWIALGCGIVLGLAMGFGLGPILGP